MTKQQLINEILKRYDVKADYPFGDQTTIFRHKHNKKWFGVLMNIPKNKIVGESKEKTEVLNVKVSSILKEALLQKSGIYTAYHMNKTHWISIIIAEIENKDLITLLDISFDLTK